MKNLYAALIKAQMEITGAKKDSSNPYFKSKYADFTSVWETVKGPLLENGLVIIQQISGEKLLTTLCHESGESISAESPIVVAKANDPQAFGSAVTYARRYAMQALLCVPTLDDDAESQYQRQPQQPAKSQPAKAGPGLASLKAAEKLEMPELDGKEKLNYHKNKAHNQVVNALVADKRFAEQIKGYGKDFLAMHDGKLQASVQSIERALQSFIDVEVPKLKGLK